MKKMYILKDENINKTQLKRQILSAKIGTKSWLIEK